MEQIDLFSYVKPQFKFPKGYKIKLFESFSGIGCQRMALKRITDNYESVGVSEIDKYALQSYEAIHGDCKNFGSICDVHELPPIDIFTWSFPCTDLSKAGKQKGLGSKEKGQEQTRSGLCYEVLRVLHENTNNLPKVLIMENVVDLIQVKFIKQFNELQREIASLGYTNTVFTMNSKNHGIPQTRDRVFMVSILGDYYYEPPKKEPLKIKLKDLLEEQVDEKYYLSKKFLNYCTTDNGKYKRAEAFNKCLSQVNDKGIAVTINTREGNTAINNYVVDNLKTSNSRIKETISNNDIEDGMFLDFYNKTTKKDVAGTITTRIDASSSGGVVSYNDCIQTGDLNYFNFDTANRVYTPQALSPTIRARVNGDSCLIDENDDLLNTGGLKIPNNTKQGYLVANEGDGIDISGRMKYHRGTVQKGITQTIKTGNDIGVCTNNLRIRKLTPRECGRLMNVSDEDITKMLSVVSNAQAYKQFGNGIVVRVIEKIMRNLIDE